MKQASRTDMTPSYSSADNLNILNPPSLDRTASPLHHATLRQNLHPPSQARFRITHR